MFAWFRRAETPSDRHDTVLELIEQVAQLRGQVRSLSSEWDDMRAQIRKGYQRMEKAYERAEKREAAATEHGDAGEPVSSDSAPHPNGTFASKWERIQGAVKT